MQRNAGDANEDPDLLRNVKAQLLEHGLAFSAVLGNHDAWATAISTVAFILLVDFSSS
jgi:hypothetical protein